MIDVCLFVFAEAIPRRQQTGDELSWCVTGFVFLYIFFDNTNNYKILEEMQETQILFRRMFVCPIFWEVIFGLSTRRLHTFEAYVLLQAEKQATASNKLIVTRFVRLFHLSHLRSEAQYAYFSWKNLGCCQYTCRSASVENYLVQRKKTAATSSVLFSLAG